MRTFKIFQHISIMVFFVSVLNCMSVQAQEQAVAHVLGEFIFSTDLIPSDFLEKQKKRYLDKNAYDQWLYTFEKASLLKKIMSQLEDEFLREEGLKPTEGELASFISFLEQQKQYYKNARKNEVKVLEQKLMGDSLQGKERSVVQQSLNQMKVAVRYDIAKTKSEQSAKQLIYSIRRRKAEMWVRKWNIEKGLYSKYGGHVVKTEQGYHPVEAMFIFFQKHRHKQSFQVITEKYGDIFVDMLQYFQKISDGVTVKEVETYFSIPWWEREENLSLNIVGF